MAPNSLNTEMVISYILKYLVGVVSPRELRSLRLISRVWNRVVVGAMKREDIRNVLSISHISDYNDQIVQRQKPDSKLLKKFFYPATRMNNIVSLPINGVRLQTFDLTRMDHCKQLSRIFYDARTIQFSQTRWSYHSVNYLLRSMRQLQSIQIEDLSECDTVLGVPQPKFTLALSDLTSIALRNTCCYNWNHLVTLIESSNRMNCIVADCETSTTCLLEALNSVEREKIESLRTLAITPTNYSPRVEYPLLKSLRRLRLEIAHLSIGRNQVGVLDPQFYYKLIRSFSQTLKVLELHNLLYWSGDWAKRRLGFLPQLETLKMWNCNGLFKYKLEQMTPSLKYLYLHESDLLNYREFTYAKLQLHTLESFEYHNMAEEYTYGQFSRILNYIPNITTFCGKVNRSEVRLLLISLQLLSTLTLESGSNIDDDSLHELSNLQYLRTFILKCPHQCQIGTTSINFSFSGCKNLEILEVPETKIDDLSGLLSCVFLKSLNVAGCIKLTSEALDWFRTRVQSVNIRQ